MDDPCDLPGLLDRVTFTMKVGALPIPVIFTLDDWHRFAGPLMVDILYGRSKRWSCDNGVTVRQLK